MVGWWKREYEWVSGIYVQCTKPAGKAAQVDKEMQRYGIEVLGIYESRWNGYGQLKLPIKESAIYSDHPNDNREHTEAVSGYYDVNSGSQSPNEVRTNNLPQYHDSKIQLTRKEGCNYPMPETTREQEKEEGF
ncbi:unnamed protein product [Trichobilharzia regenti]|nr:unnamed protein product [Trichobilharzia regenti]